MKFGRVILFAIMAVVLAGVVQLFYLPDRITCHSRWSDSGYDSRYGIASGCQVSVKGRWVPEKAIRDVQ